MTFEYIVIFLLTLIFIILTTLLIKSSKKTQLQEPQDFEKIEKQLNSLLHKTIEQSGYVNSKIDEIGDLTKKMTNAMTSNISDMGQMGEVILENILQDCGMTKNRDYKIQYTDYNEDGQQFRPDVVIFLPENRNIIIDSKVPMKDWYNFQNTENEHEKENAIKNFCSAIKNHINQISKKDYVNLNCQSFNKCFPINFLVSKYFLLCLFTLGLILMVLLTFILFFIKKSIFSGLFVIRSQLLTLKYFNISVAAL